MEFREAASEDAEGIRRVARRTWHAVYDEIIGERAVTEMIDEWYDLRGLRNSIEDEDKPAFVAVDDEIVGFVQGGPSDKGPADASVYRIYVLPIHWGEGIGTTLLDRLFDALRTDGHDSVGLSVMKENKIGRSFYEKHDFRLEERRTVELAGQDVEDLVLVRNL